MENLHTHLAQLELSLAISKRHLQMMLPISKNYFKRQDLLKDIERQKVQIKRVKKDILHFSQMAFRFGG